MGVDKTLKATKQRIYRMRNRMTVIKRSLRHDGIKEELISEYLYLNNQLKAAKIIEAEMTYYRNKL